MMNKEEGEIMKQWRRKKRGRQWQRQHGRWKEKKRRREDVGMRNNGGHRQKRHDRDPVLLTPPRMRKEGKRGQQRQRRGSEADREAK